MWLLLASLAFGAEPVPFTVTVTGIQSADGVLAIAFFNEAQYQKRIENLASQRVPAAIGTVTTTLQVPPGAWALAVYHDINNNKTLDTNWLGIPKEPYGFGNNARARTSAPSFDKANITVTAGGSATIQL